MILKWIDKHILAFLIGGFVCLSLAMILEATFGPKCHHRGCECCLPIPAEWETGTPQPIPSSAGDEIGGARRVATNPVAAPVASNPVAPPVASNPVAPPVAAPAATR
jgi:hypothetical protein